MTVIGGVIVDYLEKTIGRSVGPTIMILVPLSIELFRGKDPIEYYGLNLDSLKKLNLKVILGIGLLIFVVLSTVDNLFFNLWQIMMGSGSKLPIGADSLAFARSNMFYLSVFPVFSGTLVEELWFRGLIQYKVKSINFLRRINPHFAIIFQSILFGLVHFLPVHYATNLPMTTQVYILTYPTIVGIIAGYLNERYNSLFPGWIIHFTNNFLGIIALAIFVRLQ
ncbi:MAG: CPBP family intramembrane glutamic endopeptidase [Infirmifilum sp.]